MKLNLTTNKVTVFIKPLTFMGADGIRDLDHIVRSNDGSYRQDHGRYIIPLKNITQFIAAAHRNGFELELCAETKKHVRKVAKSKSREEEFLDHYVVRVNDEFKQHNLCLRRYQMEGVGWLLRRRHALLADDTGLGKTPQLLAYVAAMSLLLEAPDAGLPIQVIGSSISSGVWEQEVAKWLPDYRFHAIPSKKKWRWAEPGELVFSTYGIMPDVTWCERAPTNCILVPDECQALKNPKSKRSQRFAALSQAVRARGGRVCGITATPLENRLEETWNLLLILGLVPDSFLSWSNYKKAFNATVTGSRIRWGQPTKAATATLSKVVLRRRKRDVRQDLPDVLPDVLITVDKPHDTKHQKLWNKAVKAAKALDQKRAAAGLSWKSIVKIANSKSKRAESIMAVRRALTAAKIPAMFEVIYSFMEIDEPLIVMTSFLDPVYAILESDLEGWTSITGSDSNKQKAAKAKAFQQGRYNGVICTIRAASESISLTHASNMLFVDIDFNPGRMIQARGRIDRHGQENAVQYHYLKIPDTLDDHVYKIVRDKERLIDATIETVADIQSIDSSDAELVQSLLDQL